MSESAFVIDGHHGPLVAILHRPDAAARRAVGHTEDTPARRAVGHTEDTPARRAVVMIVGGGPQYRVGGHRQLTLWARRLCAAGHPVLRFDHRGMGDSPGAFEGFTALDDDIRRAIDRLLLECPDVHDVVLWGECSAASAALYYAFRDPRVTGTVLLNLWVRTRALAAQATLRYYYWQRLLQPSLWRKLLTGGLNPLTAAKSAWALWQQARQREPATAGAPRQAASLTAAIPRSLPLTEGLLLGLSRFKGRLLLVQSGRDLIAREFDVIVKASPAWQQALAAHDTRRHDLPDGDHTFSSAAQRDQVVQWALDWLALPPPTAP